MQVLISPELTNLFEKLPTSKEILTELWLEAKQVQKQKIVPSKQTKLYTKYSYD